MTTLYKRNAQGKPIFWTAYIDGCDSNYITIKHGIVGKEGIVDKTKITRDSTKELDSLFASKRKAGYKDLTSLYDHTPVGLKGQELYNYLNINLPKYNTDNNGKSIVMLCKTLDDNKPFKNSYFGEYKINGERCNIVPVKNQYDLFNPIRFRYFSREGIEWTDKMSWYDPILFSKLPIDFIERMIDEGASLDGELYLPGYPINLINSFIKNPELPQHYQLQYWIYDYVVEETFAYNRYEILEHAIGDKIINVSSKEQHLNNKEQVVLLPIEPVVDFNNAIDVRDKYIDFGFEGLVIRQTDAEYQFGGRRNNAMLKFKKVFDGKFTIVDIIPEGTKRSNLPKFVLRNDINSECFTVTINAPQKQQEEILAHKDNYVGAIMLVEYRERSGVQQVPFHAKGIRIIK